MHPALRMTLAVLCLIYSVGAAGAALYLTGRATNAARNDVHAELRRDGRRADRLRLVAWLSCVALAVLSTWLWPTPAGNVWLELLRSR